MFNNILLLVIILIIITFIVIQIKNKKNIWQKISFLYNQLYIILIEWYYNDTSIKKDILKEEIIDYYKDIVRNSSIDSKYKKWQDVKWFIVQYYLNNNISSVYDIIELYYNKYYKSIQKSILLLVNILIVLILLSLYMYLN